MDLTILQSIILGLIQGITEWLPISSSGMMALAMSNFFNVTDVSSLISSALLFHLGTFFAALIYFWKDVVRISKAPFKKYAPEDKKVFRFILVATIISGILGLIFLKIITSFENTLTITGKSITLVVSLLLLLTGIIQLKIKSSGPRKANNLKNSDGIILGLTQSFAIFPGVSRSGITISSLLLKKFDDTTALKLSFLMSLPIVLIGNILLNFNEFTLTSTAIYGLLTSFVFGLLTIHGLIKLSKKINFGLFVLIFALLMILSVFV